MASFVFETVNSILSEPGLIDQVGEIIQARFEAKHALVITDQGLVDLGLVDGLIDGLLNNGMTASVFDQVTADPKQQTVQDATTTAIDVEADIIIGFGGGSSMDVAKLVAVLAMEEQELETMYGIGNIESERLPLIQIPTTAGTGSEVTPISVITIGETQKMGVVSPVIYADMALLDAKLTLGLPAHITAATGIDAMVHAIEAYTTKHLKNPVSDMLAKQALSLLSENLPRAIDNGKDLKARENMLLGAMFAGQAFANAPVAAVHALAYPIGGIFHASHGLSNSLVLPHVLRFNLPEAAIQYGELYTHLTHDGDGDDLERAEKFIAHLEKLIAHTGIETRLSQLGIKDSDLDRLADDAMLQERLLVNNPRKMSRDQAYDIYKAAL